MIVMILEHVPARLRGELTRWLIEPKAGVYIGHVNAMVRDRLWEKCCAVKGLKGGVLQIWSTNTEQRYMMRMYGEMQRKIVELEGMQLICIPEHKDNVSQAPPDVTEQR
jgi:CRISPR-associated protein Cas2